MKKWLSFLLAMTCLVALCACGKDSTESKDEGGGSTVSNAPSDPNGTEQPPQTTVLYGTDSDGSTVTQVVTVTTPSTSGKPTTEDANDPVGGSTGTSAGTNASAGTSTPQSRPSASQSVIGSTPTSSAKLTLPAVGTDIDVSEKKNRIRVSAASASFNADGSIHVSLTVKNYASNWITEETDWIAYTCYDANGQTVQAATQLFLGTIDTKQNKVKTYTFTVPAGTAEVKLTGSKIVYWTEWS